MTRNKSEAAPQHQHNTTQHNTTQHNTTLPTGLKQTRHHSEQKKKNMCLGTITEFPPESDSTAASRWRSEGGASGVGSMRVWLMWLAIEHERAVLWCTLWTTGTLRGAGVSFRGLASCWWLLSTQLKAEAADVMPSSAHLLRTLKTLWIFFRAPLAQCCSGSSPAALGKQVLPESTSTYDLSRVNHHQHDTRVEKRTS